ncbi:MAG: acetyl-CoA carboxylase biotin carboxyl carrier protein subunit [Candidatus Limnocylindria bacterium]
MIAAELDPILRAVDLIAPVFAESDLDEVEIETEGLSVRLARPRPVPAAAPELGRTPTDAPIGTPESAAVTPFGSPMPGMRFVSAPLTGVWYTAPSPESRPYVQVGSQVATGQVIGLIEAMKLFNEIKADVSGTVTRVLIENGTLVKRQQPVLEIDPR